VSERGWRARAANRAGKKIRQVKQATMDPFKAYIWSCNIRGLQNVVERAVILTNLSILF
jgi:DNA-binding NtrC family response regulator